MVTRQSLYRSPIRRGLECAFWLLCVGLVVFSALIAATAEGADFRMRPTRPPEPPVLLTSAWQARITLEVIGAVFPTLPEPYVSVELRSQVFDPTHPPHDEAKAAAAHRMTLTRDEARSLGLALVAFADNTPASTVTLYQRVRQ